jgi:repressor LexA
LKSFVNPFFAFFENFFEKLEKSVAYLQKLWYNTIKKIGGDTVKIGERIKKRRKELNISVDELAKILDKDRATIYRYESNDIVKLPTTVLEPLSKALNVSPSYLMGWDDPEPKQDLEVMNNVYPRPIFDSVSAGFGAYADSHIVGYQPVYISNPHDIDSTICIRVTGESMYPKIEDGDMIVVRKQPSVDNGSIGVVLIGDEAVVKKITIGKNTLTLESINPLYPPRVFKDAELDGVEIVGLVQQIIKAV